MKRVGMTLLTRYEVQRVKYLASELVPPLHRVFESFEDTAA